MTSPSSSSLTQVRKCPIKSNDVKEIVSRCGGITLSEILGKGSFGIVYKGKDSYNRDIAVKVIKTKDLDNVVYEIEYSATMGRCNIGPKIYGSFFIEDNPDNFIGFLVMEPFSSSIDKTYASLPIEMIQTIHEKAFDILYELIIEQEVFCSDVKPNNFVCKFDDNGEIVVRMIDFGTDYCSKDLDTNVYKNKHIFLIVVIIQMIILIFRYFPNNAEALDPFLQDENVYYFIGHSSAIKMLYKVLLNSRVFYEYMKFIFKQTDCAELAHSILTTVQSLYA